jgi:hypothetical protein
MYAKWLGCPEAWRRHYILGERSPTTGAMFLGTRVDDTLTHLYTRWLAGQEPPELAELQDHYRKRWSTGLEEGQEHGGVRWEADLDQPTAFRIGQQAIERALGDLVPVLGKPARGAAPRGGGAGAGTRVVIWRC